jgi:thioredoxin 2
MAVKLTCLSCGQINRLPDASSDASSDAKSGSGPNTRNKTSAKCATCGDLLLTGKAVEVSPAILEKAARNDDLPLVVDFWAPWCGPCKMMAPEFARAAGSLRGQARLVKLNTQSHQSTGGRYRIKGIPTLVKFERGRENARKTGALRATQIESWLRQSK